MWIGQVYEAYAGELEAYVVHRFGALAMPEDVVHEAFARLVRETSAGRSPLLVRPWLYRVAHNLVVSELRRSVPIAVASDERASPAREARSISAEMEAEATSLSPELRQALAALSGAARISILMAAEGYSGREIAATVGRSQLATRALLCRTRHSLRDILRGPGLVADSVSVRPLAA